MIEIALDRGAASVDVGDAFAFRSPCWEGAKGLKIRQQHGPHVQGECQARYLLQSFNAFGIIVEHEQGQVVDVDLGQAFGEFHEIASLGEGVSLGDINEAEKV